MLIKPKYYQSSCRENNKTDLRQAKSILKHKPDIILFESPAGKNSPSTIFNKYSCDKKPIKKVEQIIKQLNIAATKYPYAKSDIQTWKNIQKLWSQNYNTLIYNIDGPAKLRKESDRLKLSYPKDRTDWLFWVFLYLREVEMTKNLKWILAHYHRKKNPVIAVFLESIHWQHVQFLLTNPTKKEILKFYFGRFPNFNLPDKNKEIKDRSKILYNEWKKYF